MKRYDIYVEYEGWRAEEADDGQYVEFEDIARDLEDAARYRWLKANHLQLGPDNWIRTGEDLDEAIDAEMSGD